MMPSDALEYPWYRVDHGHDSYGIMYQLRVAGRWTVPKQHSGLMLTRSRCCRLADSEACARHPWVWTAYRMDGRIVHGTRLEDVLPPSWQDDSTPYVRWWLETVSPAHDRAQAVNAALCATEEDHDGWGHGVPAADASAIGGWAG